MHPVLNAYLAEAIIEDRRHYAEEHRRVARRRPGGSGLRIRAPWIPGWGTRR